MRPIIFDKVKVEVTSANFKRLRREVALRLLKCDLNEIAELFNEEWEKILLDLYRSEFKFLSLDEDDKAILAVVIIRIAKEKALDTFFPAWLSLNLFIPSHNINCAIDISEIILNLPIFLINSFVYLLLTPPQVFVEVGEIANYETYLTNVVNEIHGLVVNGECVRRHELSRAFVSYCDLSPLYLTENSMLGVIKQRNDIFNFLLDIDKKINRPKIEPQIKQDTVVRLGILVPYLVARSETFVALPFFKYIDENKVRVTLFSLAGDPQIVTDFFEKNVAELVFLPEDINDKIRVFEDAKLDVLLFATNLTAVFSVSVILAAHRLAPLQMVDTCCPVTTGLQNIDVYLSGDLTEPVGAESYYSERLVLLHGTAQAYYLFPKVEPSNTWSRNRLGVDGELLFISGANANKIIPELRELWVQILAAVPNSKIILYPFNPNWQNSYPVSSFSETLFLAGEKMGVDRDRWIILEKPMQDRGEVLSLLQQADIYLDSIYHSGAVSILDPLLLGLPAVINEGYFGRGRQASAIFRSLGLSDYICHSEEEYYEFAFKLAQDKALRDNFSELIRQRILANPLIFDCKKYVGEFERVLLELTEQKL